MCAPRPALQSGESSASPAAGKRKAGPANASGSSDSDAPSQPSSAAASAQLSSAGDKVTAPLLSDGLAAHKTPRDTCHSDTLDGPGPRVVDSTAIGCSAASQDVLQARDHVLRGTKKKAEVGSHMQVSSTLDGQGSGPVKMTFATVTSGVALGKQVSGTQQLLVGCVGDQAVQQAGASSGVPQDAVLTLHHNQVVLKCEEGAAGASHHLLPPPFTCQAADTYKAQPLDTADQASQPHQQDNAAGLSFGKEAATRIAKRRSKGPGQRQSPPAADVDLALDSL